MSSTQMAVTIRHELSKMTPQFEMALPKTGITAERFTRVATTAILNEPSLMDADRTSLFSACMRAAQDGLLPDGREAALVVFTSKNGKVVQYMPMLAGILKKVRNSGELASITSNVIYKEDGFKYWVDEKGEHLTHTPNMLAPERGDPIGVYAMALTKDGGVYVEVMSVAQVEQVRCSSRVKNAGPWVSWWDEMARKTCIRRLSKRLPMSTDLDSLIRADDALYEMPPTQAETAAPAHATEDSSSTRKPKRLQSVVDAAPAREAVTIENAAQATETLLDDPAIDDSL